MCLLQYNWSHFFKILIFHFSPCSIISDNHFCPSDFDSINWHTADKAALSLHTRKLFSFSFLVYSILLSFIYLLAAFTYCHCNHNHGDRFFFSFCVIFSLDSLVCYNTANINKSGFWSLKLLLKRREKKDSKQALLLPTSICCILLLVYSFSHFFNQQYLIYLLFYA